MITLRWLTEIRNVAQVAHVDTASMHAVRKCNAIHSRSKTSRYVANQPYNDFFAQVLGYLSHRSDAWNTFIRSRLDHTCVVT